MYEIGLIKSFLENISEGLFSQSSQSTECLVADILSEFCSGCVEGSVTAEVSDL